jgi:hypothetical protein
MPTFVCKGAKLKCSMGDTLSEFNVTHPIKSVSLHGGTFGNIMDNKPMLNIGSCGMCCSLSNPAVAAATAAAMGILTPMPCIPNTMSPWMKGKTDLLIKGQPALMDDSKLTCMWGGTIEIIDNGQKR